MGLELGVGALVLREYWRIGGGEKVFESSISSDSERKRRLDVLTTVL